MTGISFDAVIDNQDLDIPRTNKLVYEKLEEWGYVDQIEIPIDEENIQHT